MNAGLYLGQAVPYRQTGRFSVIPTSDPCEHAASLRDWSQDYLQLSAGSFSGEIIEASVGPIQVFRETIHQCVDEKANPRRDSYTIGVPIQMEENGYWQGRHLQRDSLLTLRPNEELHFRTPRSSTILVTVINFETLSAFAHDTIDVDIAALIARTGVKSLPSDTAQRLRTTLGEALASIVSTPEVLEHEASAKALVEAVLNSALHAMQVEALEKESARNTHYIQRSIVERARHYILANRESPLTVAELSTHLKMSRRGLHHAFMNVLGINVATFLRYVRLHGARKDLILACPSESVNRIACRWGFWHMGMFASYYKALFGELPSATLRRQGPRLAN